MIAPLNASELAFEAWCRAQGIAYRRIPEGRVQGHKRPDYAIQHRPHWCYVEIKELEETPDDAEPLRGVQSGAAAFRWIDPGSRLRQSIKDAAAQLRKVSRRGFATVVCFFDKTSSFHLERVHVLQAMFGRETLHFEASADPKHGLRFLGMRHGKKATLTRQSNTSISAVAVLRQPSGAPPVIDLYHNPHGRVPIPPDRAALLVRHQYGEGVDDPEHREPNVLDLMQTSDWQEWLADPDGKCDREIEACLRDFRAGSAP